MTFDGSVPKSLKGLQQWFASIIIRPIDSFSHMNPISPTGVKMEDEAPLYIVKSPTLKPAERIELYNQQYWWRLLDVMQEGFPLLQRLFGFYEFNQKIAVPYLQKYPSDDWSLSTLGDRLSKWILEEYFEEDKELVYNAALVDAGFNESFCVKNPKALTPDDIELLLTNKIYLHPSIHLFSMPYDLFSFRREFLKEKPQFWEENDFPLLDKEKHCYTLLFRNGNNDIQWETISDGEYLILSEFKKGSTLDDACARLEQKHPLIEMQLEKWFQKFTRLNFLTLEKI